MMEPVQAPAVLTPCTPGKLALSKLSGSFSCTDRMINLKKTFLALGLIAGLTTVAHAEVDVTGHVGTTGIGFHARLPINENFSARLGLGYLGYNTHGSTDNLNYDLDLKANTYDALLDWYPKKESEFRVTGGLSYNGNRIDVRARPNASGNYTLQGNTYSAASVGSVTGKVDFNKIAPYLGVGWGRSSKKERGWSFSGDLGVLVQGSPKTSLRASGCTAGAAVCNQFNADVARENAALQDEVSKFKLYPVLRIGINYKF